MILLEHLSKFGRALAARFSSTKKSTETTPEVDLASQTGVFPTKQYIIVSAAEKPKVTFLKKALAWLDTTKTVLVNLILVFFCISLTIYIGKQFGHRVVVIEPLEVGGKYTAQGLSGRVVASLLKDKIDEIRINSPVVNKKNQFSVSNYDNSLDVEVPVAGLSLEKILKMIRQVFNGEPTKIRGELYTEGGKEFITVKLNERPPVTAEIKNSALSPALDTISEGLIKYILPYMLIDYRRNASRNYDDVIDYMLGNDDESDDAKAYFARAYQEDDDGKYEDAIKSYEIAYSIDSTSTDIINNWSVSLINLNHYNEAIAKSKLALKLDPKSNYAYFFWGLALTGLRKDEQALEMFKKALSIDPETRLFKHYASLLKKLKRNKEAEAVLEEGRRVFETKIRKRPGEADAHFYYAQVLSESEQYGKAIDEYRRAIKISPKDLSYHLALASLLEADKKWEEAYKSYNDALKINPDHAETLLSAGIVALRLGNGMEKTFFNRSLTAYTEKVKSDTTAAANYEKLGELNSFLGDHQQAIAMYNKALSLDSDNPDIYEALGRLYRDLKNEKEATRCLNKAADLRETSKKQTS